MWVAESSPRKHDWLTGLLSVFIRFLVAHLNALVLEQVVASNCFLLNFLGQYLLELLVEHLEKW